MCTLCLCQVALTQSSTSYINLNYYHGRYTGIAHNSDRPQAVSGNHFPLGLQKINNVSHFHAWRMGVTMFKQVLEGNYSAKNNGIVYYEEYKRYSVFAPSFQVGHELQLHFRDHVMLYTGVELASGIMHNAYVDATQSFVGSASETRSAPNGFFWNWHGSAQGLAGFRCNIGAMLLGVETGIVNQHVQILGSSLQQTELWKWQYRISIGYIKGYQREACRSMGCRM